MRFRDLALVAAVFIGGCATTTVTYVTPWLREVSSKDASFDSGGTVRTSVERRSAQGWSLLPHARAAVALDAGRAALRTDADGIVIVSEDGSFEDLPTCAERAAVVSPDRRRLVCFDRGLVPVGFVRGVFYAIGETAETPNDRRCALVEVDTSGRAAERTSVVQYPPDDCWSKLRRSMVLDEAQLAQPLPGP
jgi:hypothetical protein